MRPPQCPAKLRRRTSCDGSNESINADSQNQCDGLVKARSTSAQLIRLWPEPSNVLWETLSGLPWDPRGVLNARMSHPAWFPKPIDHSAKGEELTKLLGWTL